MWCSCCNRYREILHRRSGKNPCSVWENIQLVTESQNDGEESPGSRSDFCGWDRPQRYLDTWRFYPPKGRNASLDVSTKWTFAWWALSSSLSTSFHCISWRDFHYLRQNALPSVVFIDSLKRSFNWDEVMIFPFLFFYNILTEEVSLEMRQFSSL